MEMNRVLNQIDHACCIEKYLFSCPPAALLSTVRKKDISPLYFSASTFTKRSAAKDAAIKISEQLKIYNRVNIKNEMKEWVKILDENALENKYKPISRTSELQELKIKNIALINENTKQQIKIEALEEEIRLCKRMIMLHPQIKTAKLKIKNKRPRQLNEGIASVPKKLKLCKKRNRAHTWASLDDAIDIVLNNGCSDDGIESHSKKNKAIKANSSNVTKSAVGKTIPMSDETIPNVNKESTKKSTNGAIKIKLKRKREQNDYETQHKDDMTLIDTDNMILNKRSKLQDVETVTIVNDREDKGQ